MKGATPDDGYLVPDIMNLEIDTYFQPGEEPTTDSTRLRLFIRCSGTNTARPIKLEKDGRGEWRVEELSSLCLGGRPPVSPDEGEF